MGKTLRNRYSNIELLRIVSMMMVLLVHIDGASLRLPFIDGNLSALNDRNIWKLGVESFAIIGVNCFTLISGYFGINISWRKICAYIFQVIFYSVGIATIAYCVNPARYDAVYWAESWLIFTHTDLWYVPAYFMLMLLAPILNFVTDKFPLRSVTRFIVILSSLNLVFGWLLNMSFNPTGYTVWQLVWVYMIGRWIRRFFDMSVIGGKRLEMVCVYLVSLAGIFVGSLFLPKFKGFAYNSPMVVLSTVSFFMIFAGLRFRSPVVNKIALSSFSVYLIHKNPFVWATLIKPTVTSLWRSMSLWEFTFAAVVIAILIYGISVMVDPIRRKLSGVLINVGQDALRSLRGECGETCRRGERP